MADIGGNRYPIAIQEIKETKERKRLWIHARIKETEAKIAALQHTILGEQQLLEQFKKHYDLNEKSIEA